ncbi:MAG: hypothetical protein C4295_10585 [Candidatus Fervidibacterota bacterium]
MRILFVAPLIGPVHSSGRLWVKWLRRLGHEVTTFDYRQAVIPERWQVKIKGGRRLQRLLMQFPLRQVALQRPYDLIFVLKGETILPSTLRAIRQRHKGLLINWMGDEPLHFHNIRNSLPFYDTIFLTDRGWVDSVRRLGYRAEHLPYGCDPEVHRKVLLSDQELRYFSAEVCYVGRRDERENLLAQLSGVPMKIWGYGFKQTKFTELRPFIAGSALNEEEMVKAFNAAKIVLNLQPSHHVTGVNYKIHEVAGCAAFQLIDFKPEVAEMYELGKEIVCFQTLDELKELIARYLRDEGERQRIGEAAQRRAYADHTLEQRVRKMMEILSVMR